MNQFQAAIIVKRFIRTRNDRAKLIRQLSETPDNHFLRGMYRVYDEAFLTASAAYDALPFEYKTVSF